MNVLHPKKSYKLNYLAVVPPLMGILSEIGVWMPILNVFSIFLGIMGIVFGTWYIVKLKKSTKKRVSEFGLIALGNMAWIVAMITCAFMKFSSASYDNSTSSDFINQLTGFGYTNNETQTDEKSKKNNSNSSESSQTGTDKTSKEDETGQKSYAVNDTAKFEGIKVTLDDVQKSFKMGKDHSAPKQGSQFVKVSIRVKNDSDSEINVSEKDMKIKDSNGAIENPASATYTLDDQFESAILLPGGTREGTAIFEVPENDDELKLIYTFPVSGGERAVFDL